MAKKYKNELSAFDMAGTVFENGVNTTETSKGRTTKKEKVVRSDKAKENTDGKRATIGAARGCKPGYTRHTYVLPQQMIDQVKAVAQFFCCSEVSAAEQLIQKGLDDIWKKHGKKALTLQKTQTLFD
jgi:hypothetical protein